MIWPVYLELQHHPKRYFHTYIHSPVSHFTLLVSFIQIPACKVQLAKGAIQLKASGFVWSLGRFESRSPTTNESSQNCDPDMTILLFPVRLSWSTPVEFRSARTNQNEAEFNSIFLNKPGLRTPLEEVTWSQTNYGTFCLQRHCLCMK